MKFVHTQIYDGKSRPDICGIKITADCRCFIEVVQALEMAEFPSAKLQALVQHLEALTAHYSATKAAGALKAQKDGDRGVKQRAGFDWHCETATLVAKLEPWEKRQSQEEKQEHNNSIIVLRAREHLQGKDCNRETWELILKMGGYVGTAPHYVPLPA